MNIRRKEKAIEVLMICCSLVTVITTIGIILVLTIETINFFSEVSVVDFFTDTQWTPLFTEKHFGILPLLSGTLLTTTIAILRSEEHTSELQSRLHLVCRLLLEKKKK